jgi:hypothetical protein
MTPDNSDISQIEARMKQATLELHKLAPLVGAAKQTRQYDSERRKNALAKFMRPHIKAGDTSTAAETLARSDEGFEIAINELASQLESAESTIAKWDAMFASFESARSLLSMAKESMRTLDG